MTEPRQPWRTPPPAGPVAGRPPREAHRHPKPDPFNVAWRTAGAAVDFLRSTLDVDLRVQGVRDYGTGPVLFIANHFTRIETFILPYLIDRHVGRRVRTLAHWALFKGRFGEFLTSLGGFSTRDPAVKQSMVADLVTGAHDWCIYPEGSMIKNKHLWSKGELQLDSPERRGPAHTGAAVMALQAELHRERWRQAAARGDRAALEDLQRRFGVKPGTAPQGDLLVVPVNITYWPMRPQANLAFRLARLLLKTMPARLEEELTVEGSFLLHRTDVDVFFGRPLVLREWLERHRGALPDLADLNQEGVNRLLELLKHRLTRRMMYEVYSTVTVNLDHLYCAGLRLIPEGASVAEADFLRAIYLAARQLQSRGTHRSHRSIGDSLAGLLCGARNAELDDIRAVAIRSGVLRVEDGRMRVDRSKLDAIHGFHDIRLKNPVQVIANELQPLRPAIKALRANVAAATNQLRSRIAESVLGEDLARFADEWARSAQDEQRATPDIGRPLLLPGRGPRSAFGVVIAHGYLSAPEEVRPLAEHLANRGYTVYCPRLPGHGTAPQRLTDVSCDDWLLAIDRAQALLANRCRHVVLGGFSTGGLLALLAAARRAQPPAGVWAINPPLGLRDPRSRLAPAVAGWNRLLDGLGIRGGRLEAVANNPENPHINYRLNPVHGIDQLSRLIHAAPDELPRVACPALVVMADRDPVVDPGSMERAYELLGCGDKELTRIAAARHGILRGEHSEVVICRVAEFCDRIVERLRDHRAPLLPEYAAQHGRPQVADAG